MVGVPRSTGCKVCIKRRIKCDEARPECANCIKYGTTCPGYDKGLKFVVGKPHRTRRQRSFKADKLSISPASECPSSEIKQVTPPVTSLVIPPRQDNNFQLSFPISIEAPEVYQLQLISNLVTYWPTSPSKEILVISRWVNFLPSHFGRSKALDAAISSFTTQQIGTFNSDQQMLRYGRSSYVQALAHLQRSLNDPKEAVTSETQCAAMLLCIYELFAGTTAFNSWMKHAAGIARLMQFRGPDQFRNEFDHAMLLAFRGIIIMECMFNGKKCFLAEKEWQQAARESYDDSIPQGFQELFEDFSTYMAILPELLRDGYDLREAQKFNKKDLPLAQDEIDTLFSRTHDLYCRFRIWGEELHRLIKFPEEIPSPTNDTVYPIVYRHVGHSAATLYCAYWACIIIMQEILSACGCLPEDAMEGSELVDHICKSVEHNAEGIWGPFRMGFSLRIAWELADPHVRDWISDWHERFSKTYAATSPQSLPQDPFDQRRLRSPAFATSPASQIINGH